MNNKDYMTKLMQIVRKRGSFMYWEVCRIRKRINMREKRMGEGAERSTESRERKQGMEQSRNRYGVCICLRILENTREV